LQALLNLNVCKVDRNDLQVIVKTFGIHKEFKKCTINENVQKIKKFGWIEMSPK
jgi:hypothetical protein